MTPSQAANIVAWRQSDSCKKTPMAPTSFRSLVAITACALAIVLLPAPSRADDATRIRFLEAEIQKLRTQLGEQDRRIQRLEAELERRGSTTAPDLNTRRPADPATIESPKAAGPLPWHSAEAWDRIAKGMSQDEVTGILGAPTEIEAVDTYKTLFYRRVTADGGAISGHVNLHDDRVIAIKKPASQE